MKLYFTAMVVIVLLVISPVTQGQIRVNLKKKIEREANKRANQKADKAVKKTFDAAEEGSVSTVSDKDQDEQSESSGKNKKNDQTDVSGEHNSTAAPTEKNRVAKKEARAEQPQEKPVLSWAQFDFVPGTEIIYEDNQEGEQNGEFPSKWDLKSGTVENANLDGANVIWFRKAGSSIKPLMTNIDYLPDAFTIEFDYQMVDATQHFYYLYFKGEGGKKTTGQISFHGRYVNFRKVTTNGDFRGDINAGYSKGWKHASISFNQRALKVYIDDQRVINVPNVEGPLRSFNIEASTGTSTTEARSLIRNVKIAKGAVPLYDKILTDGKFITTGIKFDVNKAVIKPESMGTINYVVKMMKDNPGLKFMVEGHTDSDGDEAANQSLSEARARAIVARLSELGIAGDRLNSKGWGESKPVAGNDTPEGKAQNRRVEFVKI
ncbi:MAG TPA: hypothetical protein DCR43_05760 [Bacteroidales bacterium]|nr:MAG: hypothetical protein A2X11_03075 [Bacteroidetes bacterium GWE2_42_24]OFY28416.1 MAG: hypothetical protein A2X09_15030 [Bacteroidetes bacterium GWF2_43_11]HAQ65341.1 hypothetical protein [Bacteroidales bacterium]HBZ65456.1 hypothetical protein [Bacteroidales bacterium]